MKVSFNLLPFTSQLLVDNRARVKGFGKMLPFIKDDFAKSTEDSNDTLILTTVNSQDEDNFELISEFGETVASYKTNFSKYSAFVSPKKLSTRLKNIYKLMQLQESFNTIIKSVKTYRDSCVAELATIRNNNKLSEEEKADRISTLEIVIKYLNNDIDYHTKTRKAECDSFELTHGLKEDFA